MIIGKIYKISSLCGNSKCYIGSTTKSDIYVRLWEHYLAYSRFKLKPERGYVGIYDIFFEYGPENCTVTLVEDVLCESRQDLNKLEGEWIQKIGLDNVVNKNVAGRSQKQFYQDNKKKFAEYYQKNKVKRLEYQKEYAAIRALNKTIANIHEGHPSA